MDLAQQQCMHNAAEMPGHRVRRSISVEVQLGLRMALMHSPRKVSSRLIALHGMRRAGRWWT